MAAPVGVSILKQVDRMGTYLKAGPYGYSNSSLLRCQQLWPRGNARICKQSIGRIEKQLVTTINSRSRSITRKPSTIALSLLTRSSAFSSHSSNQHSLNTIAQERLGHAMQMYEDFVGLTEVKEAQNKVVSENHAASNGNDAQLLVKEAEQKFLQVQEDRRSMQAELVSVQADVRAVAAELEKTSRTDTRYIDLVKREHETLLVEKDMTTKIKALDKAERDFFGLLSAALRESHEKERARAEKTKYWSIIGSVIGAIIGIVGSTINNMRRMKELRAIVTEAGESTTEYRALAVQTLQSIDDQHSKLENYLSSLSTTQELGRDSGVDCEKLTTAPIFINSKDFVKHTDSIAEMIEKQSHSMSNQLQDILKLLGTSHATNEVSHVIYVGPEIESLLSKTEEKLQLKMRKNVLFFTVIMSSVITVGVGLIAFIIKGGS